MSYESDRAEVGGLTVTPERKLLLEFCEHIEGIYHTGIALGAEVDSFLLARRWRAARRFVEFAAKFGEPPVSFLASSAMPPAPQQFWRLERIGAAWWAVGVLADGALYNSPVYSPQEGRKTSAEAEADGRASGLPEWKS